MPFYMNFVEDSILDRIPQLTHFKKQKKPGFRRFNRTASNFRIPKEREIKEKFAMKIPVEIEPRDKEYPNSNSHWL